MVSVPLGAVPGGPRAPKVWNLSSIQFISLLIAYMPNFSLLSPKMWVLCPRAGFTDARDPLRPQGVPPGGFRAYILVEGCSFMLSHMFTTRINLKTFCCNLFVVPPALDRTTCLFSSPDSEQFKSKIGINRYSPC